MNKVVAIKVEHISKKYLIGENKNFPTLRDKLVELPRRIFQGPKKSQEYWALKDVSFEVKKGEVVGVIGRNGAGKSTLLKILARITEPTEGKVTMYGRVASMLEVGTGFNPELTGRENIYLNGAIIGMTKKEINQKFTDIVEFSGVEKFLDTPVKHYSSGMYVRLAFAVAAHLDADILLVDEVLAVGDTEFQKKCLGKMSDLARSGRTVIFVSHNMGAVSRMCEKVILLREGKVAKYDPTRFVVPLYYSVEGKTSTGKILLTDNKLRRNSNPDSLFKFTKLQIINSKEKASRRILLGEKFEIKIEGILTKKTDDLLIGLNLNTQHGYPLFNTFNLSDGVGRRVYTKGIQKFSIKFDKNTIAPGVYTIGLGANGKDITDWIPEVINLTIDRASENGKALFEKFDGVIICPCHWELES